MNPFSRGAKVRAVVDTKSYGVGTPIPKGTVLEVARTNELDTAQLFNAVRPDGGEYALAKHDFEPIDATPAPLDPAAVKAGDTVTVEVENGARPKFTIIGEVYSVAGVLRVGGYNLHGQYNTLTDHQPAPKPEPGLPIDNGSVIQTAFAQYVRVAGEWIDVDDGGSLAGTPEWRPVAVIDPETVDLLELGEALRKAWVGMDGKTFSWSAVAATVVTELGLGGESR